MEEQLPNQQISFWNKHSVKFLFLGIFVVASLIRFIGLSDGRSFDVDKAAIKEIVQVQQINGAIFYQNLPMLRLEGARFVVPKGFVHQNSDPFFESILPSFLIYPIYLAFNFDLEKIIYIYSVVGGLTAGIIFLTAQLFLTRFKAIFAGIFYSLGFWPIFESHLILNLSFTPLLSILIFYFTVKIIKYGGNYTNWIFLVLFLSLSIQFQAVNILLLFATLIAIYLFRKPGTFLSWKKSLVVFTIFITFSLLFILAEVFGGFEQTQAWLSYLPKMLLINIVDIYKDFFIAIGQALTVFVLPMVNIEYFYKWIIGVFFILGLILRLKFLIKNGQKQTVEYYLLILLGLFSLVIYFNYLAYFKDQSNDLTLIKSLGFFWPILTIFLTYSVTRFYSDKYFPITIIVGFLMMMNLFVWSKNLDSTKLVNSSYKLKKETVEMLVSNYDGKKSELLLEADNYNQSVFVFLLNQKNNFFLDRINGSEITVIDIKMKGDKVLYGSSIGRDIVFVGGRTSIPIVYSNERKYFAISDSGDSNQLGEEIDKVGNIRLYRLK